MLLIQTYIVPIVVAVVTAVFAGGGIGGVLLGYWLYKGKHNAEVNGINITNAANESSIRVQVTGDMATMQSRNTELLNENMRLTQELAIASTELTIINRDNDRLFKRTTDLLSNEGGCLERERINSEKMTAMENEHRSVINKMREEHAKEIRELHQKIDEINAALEKLAPFKDKNIQLAEENTRLIAEIEALQNEQRAAS